MSELVEQFSQIRTKTVNLCDKLKGGDFDLQAASFVSPPKWHLAHTTWFFETIILKNYKSDYRQFNSQYDYLFNSYYNSLGERVARHERGLLSRPYVEEVMEYRRQVDQAMMELLYSNPNQLIRELTTLGLQHEQQHQELFLTDLQFSLFQNPIMPAYHTDLAVGEEQNKSDGWIEKKRGVYRIGKSAGMEFSFDNEGPEHEQLLEEFRLSRKLVTKGDVLNFIEEGGYENPSYWHDDSWSWRMENGIYHPLYWKKLKGDWYEFRLSGLKKIGEKEILSHVNFYEAAAIAEFMGKRLPTEFEWEIASNELEWGERWEWCNSAYLPYPGFEPSKGEIGEYNGKFMVNQMVLRGASVVTAPQHSRITYRNFFHPDSRWQFSGLRLADK